MQFIPIVERATPETLAAANAGWGDARQAAAALRRWTAAWSRTAP